MPIRWKFLDFLFPGQEIFRNPGRWFLGVYMLGVKYFYKVGPNSCIGNSLINCGIFRMALDELLAGEEVSVQTSQPYGCSVKYN